MKTRFRNPFAWYAFGFLLSITALGTQSCSAKFDPAGLENAKNLATALPELMNKAATSKYSANTEAIQKVTTEIENAAKHAEGQKKNKNIAQSWRTLQSDIVTPFFARWKEKGMLDKDVVKESVSQATDSLNAIKKAEMAKK